MQSVAVAGCQNIGGILAPVSNSNENTCVDSTFDLSPLFYLSVVANNNPVWLGIERIPTCMMDMPSCWYTINNNLPVR